MQEAYSFLSLSDDVLYRKIAWSRVRILLKYLRNLQELCIVG